MSGKIGLSTPILISEDSSSALDCALPRDIDLAKVPCLAIVSSSSVPFHLQTFGALAIQITSAATLTPSTVLPHQRSWLLDQPTQWKTAECIYHFDASCFAELFAVEVVQSLLVNPRENSTVTHGKLSVE